MSRGELRASIPPGRVSAGPGAAGAGAGARERRVALSPIPWSNTPKRIRAGLIMFLLAVVHGSGRSPVTELTSAGWAALNISTEFIFGVCIGMVVRLSVVAAEVAGNVLA